MKAKNRKVVATSIWRERIQHWAREGVFLLSIASALFLVASLATYQPLVVLIRDVPTVHNAGGVVGHYLALSFYAIFGYLTYLLPIMLVYSGWLWFRQTERQTILSLLGIRWLGLLLILLGGCSLIDICFGAEHAGLMTYSLGGVIGRQISLALLPFFNTLGSVLVLTIVTLFGVTLLTGLSWLVLLDLIGRKVLWVAGCIHATYQFFNGWWESYRAKRVKPEPSKSPLPTMRVKTKKSERPTPKIEAAVVKIKPSIRAKAERQLVIPSMESGSNGALPALSLLDLPEPLTQPSYSTSVLEEMSREVEIRLQDFGISVQVVAVHPGPVITRFELQLAPGIKVSRITALAKDLARSLSTVSVRIVEVIPGKSVVGLELPNEHREVVRLSEVLSSQQYEQARSPLSLALGKDIAGHPVIVDLAKMPHLLVAGTTGSGKSVGLNAMLLSLLFKAVPEEVRLIMIDPKMLELSTYESIPHLLAPVVTDMREAANALRWCVAEMDRRYKLMAALGVRNLAGYNAKIKEGQEHNKPVLDPLWQPAQSEQPNELTCLPYIVVVIDEFADMIMVVGKKVEELIARISQKARAAGIHMILATQRPSVDVITGLIKANVPTRIAFQVSSRIDSRTILDQQGAEQLLGHGDMLYLAPGTGLPVRVHGAFVADHEVHKVVADWRLRGQPDYIESILNSDDDTDGEAGSSGTDASNLDPLYDQAVQIVIESRRASISHIQRRLKIGYNRAACIMEEMEKAGLVSSMEGSGNREVLVPAND